MALVLAIGVRTDGDRLILIFALGASEGFSWTTLQEAVFWSEFLRSLVDRALKGVQLVISDAHERLKLALSQVLTDLSWQRCRVHFMRNVLVFIPKQD